MHDLVRLYAQTVAVDALPVEERQAIQARVTAYYVERLGAVVELTESARKGQIDPARLERQLLWLDRERPALLGLVERLAADHMSLLAELLLDLAVVAAEGLTAWPEMPRLSQRMLAVAEQERNARLEAWALYHQALDLLQRGVTSKALELLGRAWNLATQTSDQGLRDRLGHARHAAGDLRQPVAEPGKPAPVPDGRVDNPVSMDRPAPTHGPDGGRTTPRGGRAPATETSGERRAAVERPDRWAIVPARSSADPRGTARRQRPGQDPLDPSEGGRPTGHPGGPGHPGGHNHSHPGGPGGHGRPGGHSHPGGSGPTGHPGGPSGGAGPQGGPPPSDTPGPPPSDSTGPPPSDSTGPPPDDHRIVRREAPRSSRVRQATETVRGAGAAPSTPLIFG
jgi:hypothetical protein